jgi:hypothetical protein
MKMKELTKSDRDKAREVLGAIRKRAASPPKPLTFRLAMHVRCSVRYVDYSVFFEREHAGQQYKIANIVKEGGVQPLAKEDLRKIAETTVVNGEEIDWRGIKCPCCSSTSLVRCGCGKLYCGGAVQDGAGDCPWCGVRARIGDGGMGEIAAASLRSGQALKSTPGRKSLPAQNTKRLRMR